MASPRDNRLRVDFEKVNRLVAESGGRLRTITATGSPPQRYVIEYHCPSLVKDAAGQVSVGNTHRVEINLGLDYPLQRPNVRMVTPVFNPHVFPSQSFCLGALWSPTETLDALILRIGAVLQLDPKVLDDRSPANGEALRWVRSHYQALPLPGAVDFRAPAGAAAPRIQWT